MYGTDTEVIQGFIKALGKEPGLFPFVQNLYEGGERLDFCQGKHTVGVYVGYKPKKAALFTVIFRHHPIGQDADQTFFLEITSQHKDGRLDPEKGLSRIRPKLIDDRVEKKRRCGEAHEIPAFYEGRLTAPNCFQMSQTLCCVNRSIGIKINYAVDLFKRFLTLHGGGLAETFSEEIRPTVVPLWSANYEFVRDEFGNEEQIRRYYWKDLLRRLPHELYDNPQFPLDRQEPVY